MYANNNGQSRSFISMFQTIEQLTTYKFKENHSDVTWKSAHIQQN